MLSNYNSKVDTKSIKHEARFKHGVKAIYMDLNDLQSSVHKTYRKVSIPIGDIPKVKYNECCFFFFFFFFFYIHVPGSITSPS